MNAETRRRALIATAKVACAASVLAGCGGQRSGSDGANDRVPVAPVGDSTAAARVKVLPATAVTTQPSAQAPAAAELNLEACESKVHEGAVAKAATDQDMLACCQLIAESRDRNDNGVWQAEPDRGYCCDALDWRGSIACTPWGPPVPPSYDWGWA